MLEEKVKQDLDGKYIVYNYGELDYDREGWGLVLYKLSGDNLVEEYKPPWGEMEANNNNGFFEYLRKIGISNVVSLHHFKDFLGIPIEWFSMDGEDNEGECECWGEFGQIWKDDDSYLELISHNISVQIYDVDRQEFIE